MLQLQSCFLQYLLQTQIESFISKVYEERNEGEAIEKSLKSLIFSLAVNGFVVGGMIGGLSGI